MKRYFTMLAALGVAHATMAQAPQPQQPQTPQTPQARSPLQHPDVRSIYNSVTWQRAMAGYYGVNTEVSPQPQTADVQQIQEIAPLLQDENTIEQALQALDTYRTNAGAGNYGAVIDQIIGSGYFQLANLSENEAEQTRFRQLAKTNLERAIERFPNYLQAHKNLANMLFQQGDSAGARTHFIKALQLGDNDPITYGFLAAIYYENQQFSAAETAARNSIMLNPTVIEFRRILGLTLFQQERYDEARAVFEELLQERPNDSFYWQMISNTLINTNEIDEAARMLEIVRFMGKADPQTLLLLGDVYMNKNMVQDAATAYTDALNQSGESQLSLPNVSTYIRPVETLNNFEAYDLATALLDQVESVYADSLTDQQSTDLLALRSEINLARGNQEEAAQNLQDILQRDPMNGRALISLAEYYAYQQPPEDATAGEQQRFRARNTERALDLFGRAQELRYTGDEGDLEMARTAYVGEGQLLTRQRQLDGALEAFRQAQSIREETRIADYISMIQSVQTSGGR